jgi:hypothetical protein
LVFQRVKWVVSIEVTVIESNPKLLKDDTTDRIKVATISFNGPRLPSESNCRRGPQHGHLVVETLADLSIHVKELDKSPRGVKPGRLRHLLYPSEWLQD